MNHSSNALFKEEGEGKRRRVTASPFQPQRRDSSSSSSDDSDDNFGRVPIRRRDHDTTPAAAVAASATTAATTAATVECNDLLSSSSEEENKNNGVTRKKSRAQKRSAEWLTSFHCRREDDSSSSDEDDDNSLSDTKDLKRGKWLTSSTVQEKLDHLTKIGSTADKALQMLLWEIGFDYYILPHQFEAIRFVAGVIKTFPMSGTSNVNVGSDSSDDSDADDFFGNKNDDDVNEMLALDLAGEIKRYNAFKQPQYLLKTRGCLIGDEMGLGKTIEALGGAALRHHLSGVKGRSKKPTLIITPQDGIQQQWYETLVKAGAKPGEIGVLGEKKKDEKARGVRVHKRSSVQSRKYLLATRYKIQSELKYLFEVTGSLKSAINDSILFSHIPPNLIVKLRNQYLAEKGKERNKYIRKRERRQDCITRLIRESFNDNKASFKIAFNTVIIDECHFLKNIVAYWGMGAALLGGQSKRTVLLSGTPYNNGPSDMSALMTFIDPRNEAALLHWWEKAVGGSGEKLRRIIGIWKELFMLRRNKDIIPGLPGLHRQCVNISAYPTELFIYENYESAFISALNKLQEAMDDGSPESIRRAHELADIMMACMSCMRMALIHPIIPDGREITIRFSPSRRHLLKRYENKFHCVLCSGRSYPTQRAEIFAARRECEENGDEFMEKEDYLNIVGLDAQVRREMDLDDDELDDEDALVRNNPRANKGEQLVELNHDICQAAGSECRHFAHKQCLEVALENGVHKCPRCYDLSSRIHICNEDGVSNVPHREYCTKTQTTANGRNGFTASAKLVKAIEWLKDVPSDEKAIILSFFKGSLDLVEGILTDELGIECARYDGDIGKEERAKDLKRFQTTDTCRVLLASVQSGGTGLNITQANHVCFLDRWFNPQVHDQAESRCHRIGQIRDVKISYMDTLLTVDDVMKIVNEYKLDNASVLLADGTSLGKIRNAIGYKDLSGVIGNSIKAIRSMRRNVIESNKLTGNITLPIDLPFSFDQLQEVIDSRLKPKKEKKDDDETSACSSDSNKSGYKSEGNKLSDEDVSKVEKTRKPMNLQSSQDSAESNDSILNYDIHAPSLNVKSEAKMANWSASQESSSSNDSILNYNIFSSKNHREDIATGRGNPQNKEEEVIDLSFDDGDDMRYTSSHNQDALTLDNVGDDTLADYGRMDPSNQEPGMLRFSTEEERNRQERVAVEAANEEDKSGVDDVASTNTDSMESDTDGGFEDDKDAMLQRALVMSMAENQASSTNEERSAAVGESADIDSSDDYDEDLQLALVMSMQGEA